MSLSTYYMRQASNKAALEAAQRLRIPEMTALKTTPIGLWLILQALSQNSSSPALRPGLRYALSRSREDVLNASHRLGAADVRARGESLFFKVMGRHSDRALEAVEKLAKIDRKQARTLLGMCAVAAAAALAETKRELNLTSGQTLGVLISEAAFMDNAAPDLLQKVRNWVFRPPWWTQGWRYVSALFTRKQESPAI
ncbi:hypothetical protein [Hyphococcus sp.]|uniref:hypothetical protein n=1 Tax=Hyphococcus sp. TaxID=2038636 RepID=UPI0035C68B2E